MDEVAAVGRVVLDQGTEHAADKSLCLFLTLERREVVKPLRTS